MLDKSHTENLECGTPDHSGLERNVSGMNGSSASVKSMPVAAPKITNEATIWRRAWIDSAIESVKARLHLSSDATATTGQPARSKPALYVAWSREPDKRGSE